MFFPLPAIDRRANGWTDRWIDALFISLTKLYVKLHDFQLSLISSTIPSLFTCWKIVESCFCFFIVSYLLLQITASNLVDGLMFAAEPVSYAYGPVDAFSKGKTPCLSKNIGVVFYNSAYTTITSVGVQPFTVHLCSRVLEGERTSFLLSISKPSHVPYWPGPDGVKSTLSDIDRIQEICWLLRNKGEQKLYGLELIGVGENT